MTTWNKTAVRSRLALLGVLSTPIFGGCERPSPPPFYYFDEVVRPNLTSRCALTTTGCHLTDDRGNVNGGVDLSSFDGLSRRRDTLFAVGPFPVGLLLLKGGDPVALSVATLDGPITVQSDIRHAGGRVLSIGSTTYETIATWISDGATRSGIPPAPASIPMRGCVSGVDPERFDRDALGAGAAYPAIVPPSFDPAARVLRDRCAGSNCHGQKLADLYLTCGDTPEDRLWNYFMATQFLSAQSSASELLDVPLAHLSGGRFHEGGTVFASSQDPDYQTLRAFADAEVRDRGLPARPVCAGPDDPFCFFVNRVQPQLIRKGCMFLGCHSGSTFGTFRPRMGPPGAMSTITMRRNYEMARFMLALESEDPGQGRLVGKNLFSTGPGAQGILHRGGSLLEDFSPASASLAECNGGAPPYDARGPVDATAAYCTVAEWLRLERAALGAPAATIRGIVYVSRAPGFAEGPLDYHRFGGAADLCWADATLDAAGFAVASSPCRSLLSGAGCPGPADIRGLSVSWDATRAAFAARRTAADPFSIHEVDLATGACAQPAGLNDASDNFDPTYGPDDEILFASTRSGGPVAADPLRPNADLFVWETGPGGMPRVRQFTYLTGAEVQPAFAKHGQNVVFALEKREIGFFQLAGRIMTPDGGDFHPFFGSRATIGFTEMFNVAPLPDLDFAVILADRAPMSPEPAYGAGALGFVNRSIGPDVRPENLNDIYSYSPDPARNSFRESLYPLFDAAAPGRCGTRGAAYRAPAPLPSGKLIVSLATGVDLCVREPVSFDLISIDRHTGERHPAGVTSAGMALDAQAVYVRPPTRPRYRNHGLADTNMVAGETMATVHVLDFPVMATLLFNNMRSGRPIDPNVGGIGVIVDVVDPTACVADEFGQVCLRQDVAARVPLMPDGSIRAELPAGTPLVIEVLGHDLQPLPISGFNQVTRTGGMFSRHLEELQFAPGEHTSLGSFRRELFNSLCAFCHGSLSGFEGDITPRPDILTSASVTMSSP